MSNHEYSIRVSRYWDYKTGIPSLIQIWDVWRGERWISGHPNRVEAEAKVRLLRKYGSVSLAYFQD